MNWTEDIAWPITVQNLLSRLGILQPRTIEEGVIVDEDNCELLHSKFLIRH